MAVYSIGVQKPLENLKAGEVGIVENPTTGRALAIGVTFQNGHDYIVLIDEQPAASTSNSRCLILTREDAWQWPPVLQLTDFQFVPDPAELQFASAIPDFGLVVRAVGEPALVFRGPTRGAGQGWIDVSTGKVVPKDQVAGHWLYSSWDVHVPGHDGLTPSAAVFHFA